MKKVMQIGFQHSQRSTELTWEEQNGPSHLLSEECVERLTEALETARNFNGNEGDENGT